MTDHRSSFRYFGAVSPGLEGLLVEELTELGIKAQATPGGVEFRGPLETLWQCATQSRLAESIRVRLKPFIAEDFASLEQGLKNLPFHAYLAQPSPVDVSVTCSKSRLYHTTAIEERLLRVITERLKLRQATPQPNDAPGITKVYVRILHNEVSVSVDACGDRLHRRGYRTHVGVAPLRETLAAAACRLLDRANPKQAPTCIWDPCCGSGTLLAEWLQMRANIPAGFASGLLRRYAFEQWPSHPGEAYAQWSKQLAQRYALRNFLDNHAYGSDRDQKTLAAARHNLTAASVIERCSLTCAEWGDTIGSIASGTAVLANLPYGVRLKRSGREASPFHALDALLSKRRDLRPALVISNELPPQSSRNAWRASAKFANGGLAVTAWLISP